jgi:hypothetical protein
VTLEQFQKSDGIEVGVEKVERRGAYVADELFDASELDKEPNGGEASGSFPINNEMGEKDSTDYSDRFDIESDES